MRKTLAALLLVCFIGSPAYAADKAEPNTTRGNWNPVLIANNTNSDFFYVMETFAFDSIYEIKAHRQEVYHSKYADEYVTFRIGTGKSRENNQGMEYDLQNCVNNVHYNGNLISSIEITSPTSCKVTCLDGGTTSCRQSGK